MESDIDTKLIQFNKVSSVREKHSVLSRQPDLRTHRLRPKITQMRTTQHAETLHAAPLPNHPFANLRLPQSILQLSQPSPLNQLPQHVTENTKGWPPSHYPTVGRVQNTGDGGESALRTELESLLMQVITFTLPCTSLHGCTGLEHSPIQRSGSVDSLWLAPSATHSRAHVHAALGNSLVHLLALFMISLRLFTISFDTPAFGDRPQLSETNEAMSRFTQGLSAGERAK